MVYLLGLGTAMSMYYMYKNKTQLGLRLVRYYTYLNEYFSNYFKTAYMNIIYLNNDGRLSKTEDINHVLMNMSTFENKFIIVDNFIVKNVTDQNKIDDTNTLDESNKIDDTNTLDESNKIDDSNTLDDYINKYKKNPQPQYICKTFYDIYYLSGSLEPTDKDVLDTSVKSKPTILKTLFDVHLDVRLLQTYANINDALFCNQINLFEKMMDWNCPLIAASLTINDSTHIYNFTEYDMTPFFVSLLRPNSVLSIDNTMKNKKLWITIFNYVFKSKNIIIPDSALENLELFWTIVFDDGNIITGKEIKIEL